MAVVLIISLYTSRVVLKALGVDDFGLFGVIGGLIGLFAFMQSSLSKATQRFLNVEMIENKNNLKNVFRTSWTIHLLIVIAIIIFAETIGLWFLNEKINIPAGREYAAFIVFQTTVVSLCLSVLQTPFCASVIAHEDMTFYAVVSVLETFLKLGVALLILNADIDHLIFYSTLIMDVSIFNLGLYYLYCRRKFTEISVVPYYNKTQFRSVLKFVGWTIVGQVAIVGCLQGTNILVNMFHSVIANAALTVGNQVSHAVTNLSSNFQMAFNPQITKLYAGENFQELKRLVFLTSKISFCLLFVVTLPLCLNMDFVLNLWLEEVPKDSGIFCILLLANNIINALSAPLNFCVLSSRDIKWFQIVTAFFYLLDILIVYFLFTVGFQAATAMWVKVFIMFFILIIRLYYAHRLIPYIDLISYFKEILAPLTFVTIISVIVGVSLTTFFDNIYHRIFCTALVFIISLMLIWTIGLDKHQRLSIEKILRNKYAKNL